MILSSQRWARLFILLLSLIILCLAASVVLLDFNKMIIFVLAVLFLSYQILIELLVALTFISPGNTKKPFAGENWKSKTHQFTTKIHTMSYFDDSIRPLIIIIHGWRSGSISMLERAKKYIELGMHVIIFEMPGHGASEPISKWTAGYASTTFIDFFSSLEEQFDMNYVTNIYFHGHSIGSFVLLQFSNHIDDMKYNEKIGGFILESPMTCYSMIFNEGMKRYRVPKILKNVYWNRLKNHFNAVNPTLKKVETLSDVDVPKWGLIKHNLLIIQAEDDDRLGMNHYETLVKAQQQSTHSTKMEHHIVAGLTHSRARSNKSRDKLIKSWIEKLNHSDSVKSA